MVKVLRSRVRGPLEPYVLGFAADLVRQGYTGCSAEQQVCFVAHLDRWMGRAGLGLVDLGPDVVRRFLLERRSAGYAEYRSARAIRPLLDFLGQRGVLPDPGPLLPVGPVEELLGRYGGYLRLERGLAAETVRGYLACVRPFVERRVDGEVLDLAGLTATDVTEYMLAVCPGRAKGTAKLIATTLRSLLGWLYLTGTVPTSLVSAVPPVAGWKPAGLPKGLEPAQLRRLLASCDRRTAMGRRDFAILLLLARLGLRAGEVATLGLDDIDWRGGELVVLGKGNRSERLPLPAEVGAAITAYLRRGRPAPVLGRSVFVRVRAPHRQLTSAGVSAVVFNAGQRAGLDRVSAHQLRHTAATAMLQAGSPLAEVGQVLRHRSSFSTAIYAKVDRDALAVLARPWPVAPAGGVA